MPDRSLLEKAKQDLDHVITSSPSLRAYMDIGQVFNLKIVNIDTVHRSLI